MSTEWENPLGGEAGAIAAVERTRFLPAVLIDVAVERYRTLTEFVGRVLRRDVDYGVIPGTGKHTLLKPGAEKLTTFFGLSTRFSLLERVEDWTGEQHGGEPFFYYLYRCQLHRGDLLVAEADGSCNSRETKYRWREARRACPACSQAAIIKGREEYGGGWVCFKKQGGCGAKYRDGDQTIESQPTGRVPNPDICDQVNTIQKMAGKRALIAAVLIAVNASEFFTQDVEDFTSAVPATAAPFGFDGAAGVQVEAGVSGVEVLDACRRAGGTEEQLNTWLEKKYAARSVDELSPGQRREVLSLLEEKAARGHAA